MEPKSTWKHHSWGNNENWGYKKAWDYKVTFPTKTWGHNYKWEKSWGSKDTLHPKGTWHQKVTWGPQGTWEHKPTWNHAAGAWEHHGDKSGHWDFGKDAAWKNKGNAYNIRIKTYFFLFLHGNKSHSRIFGHFGST